MSPTTQRQQRRRRSPERRIAILGVAAVAAVLVVGLIAYRATSGLPWQGRDHYVVELRNAERLIDAADVRIGGLRVGQVVSAEAAPGPGGRPVARVEIALEPDVGPLPTDTTAQVRPASVLGLTYVDLVLRRSDRTLAEGGTLPLARSRPSTNLTDLFEVFDRRSARHFQAAVAGLGGGLAGRGPALGAATASTSRLLSPLTRTMSSLAAPATRLPQLVTNLQRAGAAVAPVSERLGGLVTGAAQTFDALARERAALGAAITAAPGAEREVTRAFTAARPALQGLARVAADLRPAARDLPATVREITSTLRTGQPALRALPDLQRPLTGALRALDVLTRDPATDGALRKLADLAHATTGAISAIVPAQVHCNVFSLFTQGFAGTFGTQGTGQGPALASLFLATNGARLEGFQNARPSDNVGMNPLPRLDETECESGNEPWTGRQQLGNPAGRQSTEVRPTAPPPGVRERAAAAGLVTDPEGLR